MKKILTLLTAAAAITLAGCSEDSAKSDTVNSSLPTIKLTFQAHTKQACLN
jgi:PBP1b-binding outer membrane lipoprotein LpoB